jgi:elongator complex protein 3
VREIHVFGAEVPLGAQDEQTAQHRGLGARLLAEAEGIARKEYEVNKIAVISGVGARQYFETECGYQLEGHYMTKKL